MPRDVVFSGHQPNFLPYMGFFYKVFQSDVFVLDDDVQYSTSAYHNTNFINVGGQRHRITVPVHVDYGDPINAVKISYDRDWMQKLLKTLRMNYGRAPHFEEGYQLLEQHLGQWYDYLADLNIALIREICYRFGLPAKLLIASRDVPTTLKNQERNVYQCLSLGGTVYYSGVGGRAYNDEADYARNGIRLVYSDFAPAPYPQRRGRPFVENLSVIDYIFNQGFSLPGEWVRKV